MSAYCLKNCFSYRFSQAHLSSILQEKDVQMSKDAVKFRHMLEAFNSSKSRSDEINGNNPMAFMSMLLDPAVGGKCFSPHLGMQGRNQTSCKKKSESNNECKSEKLDSSVTNEQKTENKKNHYAAVCSDEEIIEDILRKNKTSLSVKSDRAECQECKGKTESEPTAKCKTDINNLKMQQDNFAKQFFTLMDNRGGPQMEGEMLRHVMNMATKMNIGETELLAIGPESDSTNTDRTAYPSSSVSNNAMCGKFMVKSRGSEEKDDIQTFSEYKEKDNEASLTGQAISVHASDTVVKVIEKLIDEKFADMEEKVLQKIEDKLSKKALEDSVRLEKIEGLLLKLCEKL